MGVSRDINVLLGKTLTKIHNEYNRELIFHTTDNKIYKMIHIQDCCEKVYIEDIIGDLIDLVGSPITMADEVTEKGRGKDEDSGTFTWTFYKFATNSGYVTIRWFGSSNGYYSEAVKFFEVEDENEYSDQFDDDEDLYDLDEDDDDDLSDLDEDDNDDDLIAFTKDEVDDGYKAIRSDDGFIRLVKSDKVSSTNNDN